MQTLESNEFNETKDVSDICLTIDSEVLDEYAAYYFEQHPKAKKKPIKEPHHPSINVWMIMKRPQMNGEKQKWKDFIIWFINKNGLANLQLNEFELHVKVYMPTKRRSDPDNQVPKFILDGLVESGMIVDDDGLHLKKLSISTDYNKLHPRTELRFTIL